MKRYTYTLTEHDLERLKEGEELIAEEDSLEEYAAIKVRWAWTKKEVDDAEEKRAAGGLKE